MSTVPTDMAASVWRGPVSEDELELRGCAGRQAGWGVGLELEVFEDADDHALLGDQSDQASLIATHATTQDIRTADSPHELGPQVAVGRAPGGSGSARSARVSKRSAHLLAFGVYGTARKPER